MIRRNGTRPRKQIRQRTRRRGRQSSRRWPRENDNEEADGMPLSWAAKAVLDCFPSEACA